MLTNGLRNARNHSTNRDTQPVFTGKLADTNHRRRPGHPLVYR